MRSIGVDGVFILRVVPLKAATFLLVSSFAILNNLIFWLPMHYDDQQHLSYTI